MTVKSVAEKKVQFLRTTGAKTDRKNEEKKICSHPNTS